jgi:hypothetical protein
LGPPGLRRIGLMASCTSKTRQRPGIPVCSVSAARRWGQFEHLHIRQFFHNSMYLGEYMSPARGRAKCCLL